MFNISLYASRRNRLISQMQRGIAVIPTAPEVLRNGDAHYPYRFDSHFHYLTGFEEPEAVLVLIAGAVPQSILFCRAKDMEREIWDGFRHGPDGAKEKFGFDAAFPIAQLDDKLTGLMGNQPALFHPLGAHAPWDDRILALRACVQAQVRSGITAPNEIHDIRMLLDEMRLIKDSDELAIMRRSATISAAAHIRAMRATRPGKMEYEIEAELLHEFRKNGAQAPAYTSIVAGGANACVLHYISNNAQLQDGELLLIDAACEVDGYAADITRSFPVNGRFNGAQKDVYELVLTAQAAAIAAARPGSHWNEPHDAAVRVLAQGFVDLKLCNGSVDAVLESGSYKRFYMHRTGHWLGMDVHDVGAYKLDNNWRALQPGMALTIEPGCYIRPADDVPQAFWNIGIRIEDDVAITAQGCEVLTEAVPKTVTAIEDLMRQP
ncbi:Xaa-Pro aminopeptidase [Candidatus Nitrotoga sp. 1052]|uniref:Xaa-Pro aminopeptidase n=1 Tax=Candidatus Nitrotoga sp. 1052 TaxID=2886964 RepID=UPI001EF675EA|nr:Xaa-Pro aminopeptidase [Candidatus Nitrotoga sp. 1052]CAH1078561.1 Xaa-Pro aminopeptidase [Candidatus Nitrotoga sp. 1052]